MNIECWNDKNSYTLDLTALTAAMKEMDTTKVDVYDSICPKCGKSNRLSRSKVQAAIEDMGMRNVDRTKMVKEENAERRGKAGKEDKGERRRK